MAVTNMPFANRIRKSPYFDATLRHGAQAFTVYNHMYMPTWYESMQGDFWHLVNGVTIWDVSGERQVQVEGKDAAKFMQYLSPRNLDKMQVGSCKYVLLCNQYGLVINDPLLLKLDDQKFWISLADSDIILWAQGLAHGMGMDVKITEPDVCPLQIQGPKSVEVMADLFGDWVRELRYFRFKETHLGDIPVVVSRTGWSNEKGYEIFLRDGQFGDVLWEKVMSVGQPYGIKPGAPNTIRRIEAAMLSYGAEMRMDLNPYELDLGRLVDLEMEHDFVGKQALIKAKSSQLQKKLCGVHIEGWQIPANQHSWAIYLDDEPVGELKSAIYSPRLEQNIGLAVINNPHFEVGTQLRFQTADSWRDGKIVEVPFYDPNKNIVRG